MSIHHLQLWVPDLDRAEQSWGWLLTELGYQLDRRLEHGFIWRLGSTGIVIEASPDMVPGMLHSRLRPGMNHVAFNVATPAAIDKLLAAGPEHGWSQLDGGSHRVSAQLSVAYLENSDGFEVELIAPGEPAT